MLGFSDCMGSIFRPPPACTVNPCQQSRRVALKLQIVVDEQNYFIFQHSVPRSHGWCIPNSFEIQVSPFGASSAFSPL
jgi:hypothetical protein